MSDASISQAELDEYAVAIRDYCRQRLRDHAAAQPGVVRDPQVARDVWHGLAVDVGVASLLVPKEHGGEGASLIEAGRVSEALGAELAPLPYLATGVLATTLLSRLEPRAASEALLRRIVDGAIVAVAWSGGDPGGASGELTTNGTSATGSYHYVIDADLADVVLLVSPDADRVVAAEAGDLTITARPSFDLTRGICDVRLDDAAVSDLGPIGDAFDDMLRAGRLALAAESAGGAQAALDLAVTYAKQRVQFGREIGSFQAIKHLLADAYVAAESAISVSRLGAAAVVDEAPDAAQLSALAAFYPAEQFSAVAKTGIQVHGGIGFTVECAAHLYRRRAESNRHLLGDPAELKAAYVAELATDGAAV